MRQSRRQSIRAFSATPARSAEVELTVGALYMALRISRTDCLPDGKKVSIEGMLQDNDQKVRRRITITTAGSALIQACEKAGVTIPR